MKLIEAKEILEQIVEIPFKDIFPPNELEDAYINKGKSGQLVEKYIGLKLSNNDLDFEDGELKTNKCDLYGNPKETIAITTIGNRIDDLLNKIEFEHSFLYQKIKNVLYVFIYKDLEPKLWKISHITHIDLDNNYFLKEKLKNDYYMICNGILNYIEKGDNIHTISGNLLQIRTKDSKNSGGYYHPIYSTKEARYVSTKNFAFYFRKDFIKNL